MARRSLEVTFNRVALEEAYNEVKSDSFKTIFWGLKTTKTYLNWGTKRFVAFLLGSRKASYISDGNAKWPLTHGGGGLRYVMMQR